MINQAVSDCDWMLTTRTGPQALLAIIVDQFNSNTPDDDTDDTFTVTGYAIKTGQQLLQGPAHERRDAGR